MDQPSLNLVITIMGLACLFARIPHRPHHTVVQRQQAKAISIGCVIAIARRVAGGWTARTSL
jgi:hypothetical protein